MKSQGTRRTGGAALVALVCLSVVTLVIGGLLRVNHARMEQVRTIEHRLQAEWLVEAGLERAVARLSVDPAYQGERWSIPSSSLEGQPGMVTIEVSPPGAEEPATLNIRVQADYPSTGNASGRSRRSKSFTISPIIGPLREDDL